jgi:hypothetical protein
VTATRRTDDTIDAYPLEPVLQWTNAGTVSEEHGLRPLPIYIDDSQPEIHDPSRRRRRVVWQAANTVSFKLLRCLEAARDLTQIVQTINERKKPHSKRRIAKLLATPLFSLASGVADLYDHCLGDPETAARVDESSRLQYRLRAVHFRENLPLDKQSALRRVRDKMAAHIDIEAMMGSSVLWNELDFARYLLWIRLCLIEVLELLKLDVYAWTQDSNHKDVVRLMSVDGTLVDLYVKDGRASAILNITFAKSPKYGIEREIKKLIRLCAKALRRR